MAPRTTVAAHQAAQRGPNHVGMSELSVAAEQAPSNGHAAAEIDQLTGNLVDFAEPDDDDGQPTAAEVASFDRIATLISLNVEAACTAEMSLHMITERVRQAIHAAGATIDEPTDADIVAEAERIWTSFTDNRTGPREYTDGPDGLVRDWRRPDTTPDRGDVPVEHTISGDGVRATITNNQTGETVTLEEAQIAAQRPTAGHTAPNVLQQAENGTNPSNPSRNHILRVPSDAEFGPDDEFFVSSALKVRAEVLRDRHPDLFEHLDRLAVVYLWRKTGGKAKGLAVFGKTTKPTGKLKFFSEATFVIELSADHCRGAYYGDPEIEQLLFHEMLHTGESEADEETGRGGGPAMIPHQLEIFHAEIEVYGLDAVIFRDAAPLFRAAVLAAAPQMGLFSEDAVHREARLASIVLTDADQAADPVAEYTDDVLADPAVI